MQPDGHILNPSLQRADPGANSAPASIVTGTSDCIVDAASTADVPTRSGLALTIDGVALNTSGMRILLKDQATASQNGVWAVRSGAWFKLGQQDVVFVKGGAVKPKAYLRTSPNVYESLTSGLVKFTHWIVCDQSAPATVQPLDPITLLAFSNNENNYTSTTLGKKSVIKIPAASLKASIINAIAPRLLLPSISWGGSADYPGAVISVSSLSAYMRITAITADFDITVLTWNGLSGLTLGNTLFEGLSTLGFNGSGFPLPTGTLTGSSDNTQGVFVQDSVTTPCYGLLIEAKAQNLSAVAATAISGSATLTGMAYSASGILIP